MLARVGEDYSLLGHLDRGVKGQAEEGPKLRGEGLVGGRGICAVALRRLSLFFARDHSHDWPPLAEMRRTVETGNESVGE